MFHGNLSAIRKGRKLLSGKLFQTLNSWGRASGLSSLRMANSTQYRRFLGQGLDRPEVRPHKTTGNGRLFLQSIRKVDS